MAQGVVVMNFEDILENIENNGYTVVAIMPDDDNPYSKYIVVQDANGNTVTKHYVLSGYTEIKDENGNVIGLDENWVEVSA